VTDAIPDETPEETLRRLNDAASSRSAPSGPGARFPTTVLREGYDIEAVDAFLDGIADRTREEIDLVRFPTVHLRRGYAMDAVDDELDRRASAARSISDQDQPPA
jgi:DivIVA domain-containing protein